MAHYRRGSPRARKALRLRAQKVYVEVGDGRLLIADAQSAMYFAAVWAHRQGDASPEQVFGGAHGAFTRVMDERRGVQVSPSPREEAARWSVRVPS